MYSLTLNMSELRPADFLFSELDLLGSNVVSFTACPTVLLYLVFILCSIPRALLNKVYVTRCTLVMKYARPYIYIMQYVQKVVTHFI